MGINPKSLIALTLSLIAFHYGNAAPRPCTVGLLLGIGPRFGQVEYRHPEIVRLAQETISDEFQKKGYELTEEAAEYHADMKITCKKRPKKIYICAARLTLENDNGSIIYDRSLDLNELQQLQSSSREETIKKTIVEVMSSVKACISAR